MKAGQKRLKNVTSRRVMDSYGTASSKMNGVITKIMKIQQNQPRCNEKAHTAVAESIGSTIAEIRNKGKKYSVEQVLKNLSLDESRIAMTSYKVTVLKELKTEMTTQIANEVLIETVMSYVNSHPQNLVGKDSESGNLIWFVHGEDNIALRPSTGGIEIVTTQEITLAPNCIDNVSSRFESAVSTVKNCSFVDIKSLVTAIAIRRLFLGCENADDPDIVEELLFIYGNKELYHIIEYQDDENKALEESLNKIPGNGNGNEVKIVNDMYEYDNIMGPCEEKPPNHSQTEKLSFLHRERTGIIGKDYFEIVYLKRVNLHGCIWNY